MLSNRRSHYLGLALVAGLSFGLRFWQLGRFNSLVFDEVYYVEFAQAYLAGEPVFDAHPPLGKFAIAAGIWIYTHTYWLHSAAQTVTAEVNLVPVSYRWMNALVGSLVPLVVVGLVNRLTGARKDLWGWRSGVLAGVFVAVDGLFVTESRYGLLNIYIVFFGLLGHWLWIVAGRERRRTVATMLRGLSGVALGCAIATKWNGLGYVLALVIWEGRQQMCRTTSLERFFASVQRREVLLGMLYLGLLPLVTYCFVWWPHLQLGKDSFMSIHRTLFLFHQGLDDVQAACSRWFTWPLLIKPVSYWYEKGGEQVYTVSNLGNPILWWLSGASVVLLVVDKAVQLVQKIQQRVRWGPGGEKDILNCGDGTYEGERRDAEEYLLIGYLANWLPWLLVERCTYSYLFMPAAVFGFMLLALRISEWLTLGSPAASRWFGFVLLGAIAFALFFWMPLSLGSPLSPEQLQLRWWLPSWI